MCGITACVGAPDVRTCVLDGLENLEYRGYDSAGVAVRDGTGVHVSKHEGEISRLASDIDAGLPEASVGIGHTRWSTHGAPTDANAHPHEGCEGDVAVVHNGIIDNYAALRSGLEAQGHTFASETDTEVIPHLIESYLAAGCEPEGAFRRAVTHLDGSYAVAAVVADADAVFAARNGSPLVLGVGDGSGSQSDPARANGDQTRSNGDRTRGANFLASDAPAFIEYTDRVVYLEDGDVVRVGSDGYAVTDVRGDPVDREETTVDWEPEDAMKGGYDHYMLKEIHEQPDAIGRTLRGRVVADDGRSAGDRGTVAGDVGTTDLDGGTTDDDVATTDSEGGTTDPDATGSSVDGDVEVADGGEPASDPRSASSVLQDGARSRIEDLDLDALANVDHVQFVACGTSYHAGLYGKQLLMERGGQAHAYRAAEYATNPPPLTEDTLVIAVTQSGETADTLEAIRTARDRGAKTLAVTNVIGSTALRECDDGVLIRAGPEIGVAATKTFSSQVCALSLLAECLLAETDVGTGRVDAEPLPLEEFAALPDYVEEVLDDSTAERLARKYHGSEAFFFIGRGVCHSVALEGALKLKEISYEHAEGFPAGELKHGPLALVTPDTTVIAVLSGRNDEKTASNVREVAARGGNVVAVTDGTHDGIISVADDVLELPETKPEVTGVLANLQLQLFSYHVADRLDRAIDKPRNLAKSVTVQ